MPQIPARRWTVLGAGALACAVAFSACGAPPPSKSSKQASTDYTVLTPKPSTQAGDVVWSTYRETQTLDPIQAFDYPENTVDPLLCDSLLRQAPDQTLGPGIATYTAPTSTEYDFTLNSKATFWDGSPVTAQDAVFSLERAMDPKAGGYYAQVFDRVKSIKATGTDTFTITLTQPDQWLLGELSATPGEVVEKKYVEAKGKAFGTVSGGTMCSGPFKLDSWKTGQGVKMVPNPDYWDTSLPTPQVKSLTVIGTPDDATLTAGLSSGAINGSYGTGISTLGQMEKNSSVSVYQGAPYATASMVVSATKGALAGVAGRQALSEAIDRQGIIDTVFQGAGSIPHAAAASGTWGYAQSSFKSAYDALPAMTQDLSKAKADAKAAGIVGQTITIGTSSGIPTVQTETLAVQQAAEAIGLKVKLKNVSPSNYINFFIDPKYFGSVDMFSTINYGDYADPAALYNSFAMPGGSQNFSGYDNQQVTEAMNAARGEADPAKRAQDVIAAQKVITEQLVWIPLVAPNTVLVMNDKVTGPPSTFSFMFSPWASYLGGS
ncbi:MAG TPA: ABC transporter substrate-binding protein [Nocardioides sp.]|nr:ABC transporter substrate-binding protein [Nocardioides sp.]